MRRIASAALCALALLAAARLQAASPSPDALAVGNTADLPGRCRADRYSLDLTAGQWLLHSRAPGDDADAQAISAVLETFNPDSPTLASYLAKRTDYYGRREEVQRKLEARIFGLPSEQREQGLSNYSYMMLYLGEFKKIVQFFGPRGRGRRPQNGIIAFALAQSYFRLGLYRESLPYAKKAFDLMPEKAMDTRWQIMLTELGLHGAKLPEKYSKKYYDMRHVKTLFPNEDWSALPFTDVTMETGLGAWGGTGAVNFADLDGDGYDDLLVQKKGFPSRIYRNERGQGFVEVPEAAGTGRSCNQLAETVADFDNDGLPDLQRQCCNYDGPGPNSLLKNMGGFRFSDVTVESGLDYHISAMINAWGDYDLDGRLDLIASDHWGPVRLYRGNSDGTFTDTTRKAGIVTQGAPPRGGPRELDINEQGMENSGAYGCAFGDYDGDRHPDLFCNGWDWAKLFHNSADGTFSDVTAKAGIGDGKGVKGYNVFWLDYDNDGDLDLYAGRYVVNSSDSWGFGPRCTCSNLLSKEGFTEREWNSAGTIYRNNGDGTFTNMVATTKFLPIGVMGVNEADWDNDGDRDIVMGTGGPYMQQAEPYLFYENNGDGTFRLQTPFTMRSLWGKGHGGAFADYDHDGSVDLILNNGGAHPGDSWPDLLLRNRGGDNHWLSVRLRGGPGTNSLAVGAQVELWAGKLRAVQELAAGGRFSATNSFALHFGLARNKTVDRLVVRWPGGKKTITELKSLAADQAIEIAEADGSYRRLWGAPEKPAP